MTDIYQENIPVRFASVDRSDRLTLAAIFDYFQNAAIDHAEALGAGRNALKQTGQAWILSRFSVFAESRPYYDTKILLKSWPRPPEKLFFMRDYQIEAAENNNPGKIFVRGRSAWLVIDINKRRPLRMENITLNLPVNRDLSALETLPQSLAACKNITKKSERTAAYSDIDYYGHVNNARYVQWIQDICPQESLEKANQIRFDINYLNETLPGEKAELYSSSVIDTISLNTGGNDYPKNPFEAIAFEGRRAGQSDQIIFRAELILGS